jgi:hypothetical protein
MCNLYSITTNQAAIIALFRVVNRYVGNLAPMPGVFPDYKAPIVRNGADGREPDDPVKRWNAFLAPNLICNADRCHRRMVSGLGAVLL